MEAKKKYFLLSIIILVVIVSAAYLILNQERSTNKYEQENNQKVITILEKFLTAVKEQDVTTVVSHLRDEAFIDKNQLIEFYTESLETERLLDFEILPDVNFDKNGDAIVNVKMNIEGQGEVNQPFTLREIEGEWMVYFAKLYHSQ